MATYLEGLQSKASKALWLGQKYLRQRLATPASKSAPLFIVGCQRSGTNMLMQVLGRSLDTWVYSANNPRAFNNRRIKPTVERQHLLQQARCRWLVFKPLSDTQNIDHLLADHPNGKAIWIFRRYQDVSNSAVREWGEYQRKHIERVATRDDWQHWLVERMSQEQRNLVRQLYHKDISLHSAAALKWYLRNVIYFDYALDQQPDRVLLVRYEDLVRQPLAQFKAIFDFLGIDFNPIFVSKVYATSVGKESFPKIDPAIELLCEEMMSRLTDVLEAQAGYITYTP